MQTVTPEELATTAVLALEHNADTDLNHDRWIPFLRQLIDECLANADSDMLEKLAWLDQPREHPTNPDNDITTGEALLLSGLVTSATDGVIWSLIDRGMVTNEPF